VAQEKKVPGGSQSRDGGGRVKRISRWSALLLAVLLTCQFPLRAGFGNNFVYGQLKYPGAWDPYPEAHQRILQMVRTMTNIPVSPDRNVVTLGDPAIFETPFLLIKGNGAFDLSADEKIRLKEYIDRGGFVFADDTLADYEGAFGKSIKRLMSELFPDKAFQRLPLDHAVYRSFFLLRSVAGRRISENFMEGLDVGSSGLAGGRTAVIYCPNDLLGAWMQDNLGHYVFPCEPGGESQRWNSFKLMINVIYFSLTGTYKKDAIHQPFIEKKLEF